MCWKRPFFSFRSATVHHCLYVSSTYTGNHPWEQGLENVLCNWKTKKKKFFNWLHLLQLPRPRRRHSCSADWNTYPHTGYVGSTSQSQGSESGVKLRSPQPHKDTKTQPRTNSPPRHWAFFSSLSCEKEWRSAPVTLLWWRQYSELHVNAWFSLLTCAGDWFGMSHENEIVLLFLRHTQTCRLSTTRISSQGG